MSRYTFQDVLEIRNGRNQKKVENPNGKYPIYGSGGIMGYADDYICEANTVIIGRKGSINNPIFVSEPFWNVDTAFGLVANKCMLLPRYLYYFCEFFDFERLNKTVTIPSLTKTDLLKIKINLPDIQTQKQIINKIHNVEIVISLRNQQLKKLDELVKSRFVEMFGDPEVNSLNWNNMNLANCIVKSNNGMARRGNDANGNIVLRLVELQTGYIDYSSVNRIQLSNDEKQKYLLNDNDFLFARVNGNPEYVGRCATFRKINEPVYHNDHIIRVRFNEKLLSCTFLSVLLNSDYGKRQMKSKIKTSAGQYTISQDGIAAIRIPIPPLRLQTTFADFVAKVENQKATVQKSIDKLEMLKKSLMQEYFG